MRFDGRTNDQMRPTTITPGYLDHPEGSALIEMGRTRVVCTATIEERVPFWLRDQAQGWVTAEYREPVLRRSDALSAGPSGEASISISSAKGP
jgi:ribonuclease PH